jgi:hypothetical protein
VQHGLTTGTSHGQHSTAQHSTAAQQHSSTAAQHKMSTIQGAAQMPMPLLVTAPVLQVGLTVFCQCARQAHMRINLPLRDAAGAPGRQPLVPLVCEQTALTKQRLLSCVATGVAPAVHPGVMTPDGAICAS